MNDTDPKRVLVAEGNDLNRQILEDHLVFCGYRVLSLASGSRFLQALVEFQPLLILLDLRLPDVDGYTILEEIQRGTQWRHIPVIALSASAFKADQQRLLRLGVSRYFVSPVVLTDLMQAVQAELHD